VALVLASALSWAWFSVLVHPLTERVAGLHVGAYTMLGGGIVSLGVGIPAMLATPWGAVSNAVWGALAYSTIGAMVIAYLFWYHGVKTLGPTHTSMYSNLQPLLAMGIAWAVLSEMPTAWQLSGAVLIMTGLLIARTAAHEPEAA
jgi:drug/metabolite transporter (DMT)-like permease